MAMYAIGCHFVRSDRSILGMGVLARFAVQRRSTFDFPLMPSSCNPAPSYCIVALCAHTAAKYDLNERLHGIEDHVRRRNLPHQWHSRGPDWEHAALRRYFPRNSKILPIYPFTNIEHIQVIPIDKLSLWCFRPPLQESLATPLFSVMLLSRP